MTAFSVGAGQTQTSRITMAAADTLTVAATGALSVSANAQAVRFTASANGAIINNSGTIEDTAGRAIRFENTIASPVNVTINNLTAGSLIQGTDDAFQIAAAGNGSAVVTSGLLTLSNAGSIISTGGQALDFAATGGTFVMNITNSGTIRADVEDAVRIGSASATNSLTNSGTIIGGSAASYSGADGVQFEDNSAGTLTNNTGGAITGDRHGVNMGVGSTVTVINETGATITGNNGSGVGSDGTASVTNRGTITGNFDPNATDINGPGGGGVPDGIPDGDGDGIDIDGQATIQNFGLIQGTGASGNGSDGLPNTSEGIAAGGGTITNHTTGTIRGLGLGILIDNSSQGNAPFQTTIINDGIIEGTNSIGIKIVSTFADVIDNSGTISGGGGTAILFGTGHNTLKIRTGSVIDGISDGGAGTDTLDYTNFGGAVSVNLGTGTASGTSGVTNFENVTGGAGNDTLTGDGSANVINGGAGDDVMAGGGGNDRYIVDDISDLVNENANEGYDIVVATADYLILPNVEALYLKGTGLTGTGSNGNDTLLSAASAGANTMIGRDGNDLYYVNHIGDVVTEVSGEGADTVVSTVSYTIPDNVETMYLVGSGLTGTGSSNGETLISSGGPNTLIGLGGNDLYIVQNAGDVVTEAANGGIDTVIATVSYTLPANVEGLYLVGSGLTGTGTAGNDTLLSSGGPNTLIGGDGNDIYYVNNTGDVVTEGANGGIDTIATTVSYALPANVEALYLLGSGLTGTGTNAGETLLSSGGPNTMIGLGGDDLYYVNNTGDVVTEAANGGFDSVVASVSYTLAANVDVLYMSGTGLTGTGNSAANTLTTTGANTLVGGAGDDAFVFFAGTANGAAVSDFDGNAVGEHDYLILSGFGTAAQGATFTQIGVSDNWQIHSGLDSHDETVTFSNHALPQAGDFLFV